MPCPAETSGGMPVGPRRYKLGINRDPAPFVFPESFVVLLGGPDKAESPNFKKVRACIPY